MRPTDEPNHSEHPGASGAHLQTIFGHTTEGFVLLDMSLHILASNEMAGELIFQHGEAGKLQPGSSLLTYLLEPRRAPFLKVTEQALAGKTITYEQAYALPAGGQRWFQFIVSPVRDADGISGLCISGRDITAQVDAQQELIRAKQEAELSGQQYRRLFDQSPIPKWIFDLDTLQILEVNTEAIRLYGYTRKEFLALTILDLRLPEDRAALMDTLQGVSTGNAGRQAHHGYWRHLKKTGEIIVVDITGHAVDFGERRTRMVVCQDVTARVEAETALLRSNERFRYAVRAASDAIWDWDIATEAVFLGEGFKTLFGYTEAGATVPRQWIMDKLHPEDLDRVTQNISAVIGSATEDRWSDEYRFQRADGTYAVICNTALLLPDELHKPLRLIGAMRDVTESRAQLQAIRAQNERLQEIAWTQSHIVRAPLARLLGLTELALSEDGWQEITELLPMLKTTAEELDSIIRGIVSRSCPEDPASKT